jgi:hypothetical protein
LDGGLLSLALFCSATADIVKLDPDLELEELRPGLFLHRSWLTVEGFGRVECNGLVYINSGEANAFPEAETIVPGHGKPGGRELLQDTIDMFATE